MVMGRNELLDKLVTLIQSGGITKIVDDRIRNLGQFAWPEDIPFFYGRCRIDRRLARAGLRMDPKFMRLQDWKESIPSNPELIRFYSLGQLMTTSWKKGNATRTGGAENGEGLPLISTADLRNGYARPGTFLIPDLEPNVMAGDLVIAVDGEGSAGKAGIVECEEDGAILDSHVAILGIDETIATKRYICVALNSSWCRMQTEWIMRGSSGQMALSESDAISIVIPVPSFELQEEIASAALMFGMSPDDLSRTIDLWLSEVFGEIEQTAVS